MRKNIMLLKKRDKACLKNSRTEFLGIKTSTCQRKPKLFLTTPISVSTELFLGVNSTQCVCVCVYACMYS